jgi:hypothetical protein
MLPHAGSSPSIQELLASVGFPVSKEQLIESFQQNGATDMLLDRIRGTDKTQFTSASDVMESIRKQ